MLFPALNTREFFKHFSAAISQPREASFDQAEYSRLSKMKQHAHLNERKLQKCMDFWLFIQNQKRLKREHEAEHCAKYYWFGQGQPVFHLVH